ncbi:P22 phage major capsid protein family protein [Rathayibacter sp. VKM Ac-2801]|uniref:P22 phage major capsid protein family protein n=1 Tax=Rathayibacter sp. VKM Ac-2801 TaxID=2609255 RepID=UPI00131FDBF3|nr:P22 phage major capsid protein family protein [Rathayibacter sp. VKM Ac-2801]QHC70309.1 hypothetical protein GSU45_07945 [Rathayibacter sp. VKM Ac-2801]
MPNAFLTPNNIATVAANLVGRDLNLGALIARDLEADFEPGKGMTVKVRVPGAIASQTKPAADTTTPLVTGKIAEQFVSVELTDHVYNAVVLSEADLDLEIGDFTRQVLDPQTSAITKHVERAVAAALKATPESTTITYDATNPARTFTAIRSALRAKGVTAETPIVAAVGSQVYADLLDGPVGSAGTTFDSPGVVRGIKVVESTRLAPDEIVAFVKNAFSLVVRAPEVPEGAPFGASVVDRTGAEPFALRWIRSYDGNVAVDRSVVSAFVGVNALPLPVDNEDGTVTLVPNGGAVRVLTGIPAAV